LAPAIEPGVPADVAPAAAPVMGDSAFEGFDAQATAEPPHKTAQMRVVRAFRPVARVNIPTSRLGHRVFLQHRPAEIGVARVVRATLLGAQRNFNARGALLVRLAAARTSGTALAAL
jgi:hypothetical protein